MQPKQGKSLDAPESFDAQADAFDQRSGIPAAAAQSIARAVDALVPAGPGIVLDLAAGTGEVGSNLAQGLHPYVALDVSLPMLSLFRQKLVGGVGNASSGKVPAQPLWVQADANRPWPLRDDSVALLFSSRAIHLLRLGQLLTEIQRVRRTSEARIVLGSVRRRKDSVRHRMRHQMRRLLDAEGFPGRSGRRGRRCLIEALQKKGWQELSCRQVAEWTVLEKPRDTLDAWRRKDGLGGQVLPSAVHQRVLKDLEVWAQATLGDLGRTHASEDSFELDCLTFRP